MAFNPRVEEAIDLVEETEPEFYRGNCTECGKYIESAYCGYNKKTRTYICYGCGAMHPVHREGKRFKVRLTNIDGKRTKSGNITLGTSIANFINLCGNHGWLVEYTQLADTPDKEVTTGMKEAFAQ